MRTRCPADARPEGRADAAAVPAEGNARNVVERRRTARHLTRHVHHRLIAFAADDDVARVGVLLGDFRLDCGDGMPSDDQQLLRAPAFQVAQQAEVSVGDQF